MDEMAKCGHYRHWRRDFDLVEEIGVRFLRYGPPLHTTLLGARRYDWSFADEVFPDLRRRNIVAIVDLCHFGPAVADLLGGAGGNGQGDPGQCRRSRGHRHADAVE